jgi:hypothetical protein
MSEFIKIGEVSKLFSVVKEVQPLQKAILSEPPRGSNNGYKVVIGILLLGFASYKLYRHFEDQGKKEKS